MQWNYTLDHLVCEKEELEDVVQDGILDGICWGDLASCLRTLHHGFVKTEMAVLEERAKKYSWTCDELKMEKKNIHLSLHHWKDIIDRCQQAQALGLPTPSRAERLRLLLGKDEEEVTPNIDEEEEDLTCNIDDNDHDDDDDDGWHSEEWWYFEEEWWCFDNNKNCWTVPGFTDEQGCFVGVEDQLGGADVGWVCCYCLSEGCVDGEVPPKWATWRRWCPCCGRA